LALFALAIQLVVSFGHLHLDRKAPLTAPSIALVDKPAVADAGAPSEPAGDETPALGHDFCAICALMHLAGTALAVEPPALPLPIVFDEAQPPLVSEFGSSPPDRRPFAARAPPTA
jgi:hypothetical protein